MQRALRNYRTRTGIVDTPVPGDEESELEWPGEGRDRHWTSPRITAPIENGGYDDTSVPHLVRWWKTWSRDQGAFYYWKDGSEHTQWEDPMDDSSLGNVAVRTWGGAELEYGMEEGPTSGGSAVPNPAQKRPHANETGTYDAVREVMAMTDSGEEMEPMDDYERRPSEKGGTANSRSERTPEDELPLHQEARHSCVRNEAGIDDNGMTFSEEYLGRRRLAYFDLSEGGSPPQEGKCRYCGIGGLYCEGKGP